MCNIVSSSLYVGEFGDRECVARTAFFFSIYEFIVNYLYICIYKLIRR